MFSIFATNPNGHEMRLFTWTRDAASGIERAKYDATQFGYSETYWRDYRAEEIDLEDGKIHRIV